MTIPETINCSSIEFSVLSTGILRQGKSLRFQAKGPSMQPLIRDDDTLLIRPVDEKRIRTGDVVLCSNFLDHALVHRVIAKAVYKNEIHFLVKGDQASKPDGWLPGSRIVGKVSEINRAGSVIAMDQPIMKFLGLLAAIRSRWNFGHLRFVQFIWKYVKELPIFYKYIH